MLRRSSPILWVMLALACRQPPVVDADKMVVPHRDVGPLPEHLVLQRPSEDGFVATGTSASVSRTGEIAVGLTFDGPSRIAGEWLREVNGGAALAFFEPSGKLRWITLISAEPTVRVRVAMDPASARVFAGALMRGGSEFLILSETGDASCRFPSEASLLRLAADGTGGAVGLYATRERVWWHRRPLDRGMFLVRFDSACRVSWLREDLALESTSDVAVSDGHVLVSGSGRGSPASLLRVDLTNGALVKRLPSASFSNHLAVLDDDSIVVGGWSGWIGARASAPTKINATLARIGMDNDSWQQTLPSKRPASIYALTVAKGDQILAVIGTLTPSMASTEYALHTYGSDGALLDVEPLRWQDVFDVDVLPNGQILIAGQRRLFTGAHSAVGVIDRTSRRP